MIYLDSAALVKLVRPEAESAALREWLRTLAPLPRLSSVVAEIEVARAVRRSAPQYLDRVAAVVEAIDLIGLGPRVRSRAATFGDPGLRSLDAVHLASAGELAAVTGLALVAFVTYDRRLYAAAEAIGLPAHAPS